MSITDTTLHRAMIAVQGPRSRDIVMRMLPEYSAQIEELGYYRFLDIDDDGQKTTEAEGDRGLADGIVHGPSIPEAPALGHRARRGAPPVTRRYSRACLPVPDPAPNGVLPMPYASAEQDVLPLRPADGSGSGA